MQLEFSHTSVKKRFQVSLNMTRRFAFVPVPRFASASFVIWSWPGFVRLEIVFSASSSSRVLKSQSSYELFELITSAMLFLCGLPWRAVLWRGHRCPRLCKRNAKRIRHCYFGSTSWQGQSSERCLRLTGDFKERTIFHTILTWVKGKKCCTKRSPSWFRKLF